MRKLLLAIFIVITAAMLTHVLFLAKNGHKCQYKDCPYKGQTKFTYVHDCYGNDFNCNYLDSIHFIHPKLTYDECEAVMDYHMKWDEDTTWQEHHK